MSTITTTVEADLVTRLRAGDEEAYAIFVRQYGGRMLTLARRFLHNEDDAADAVQDAFLAAFRALPAFEGNSALATWLHRIIVNGCLMKLRSNARRRTCSIEDLLPTFDTSGHHAHPVAPWSESAYDSLVSEESRAQVRACIDQLPDDYRTVLLLRDIEQLDTEQTAAILGLSHGAVKTRLHRARQALRGLVDPFMK
ncbi:MAG: sigma-70 family RNA polymerase sigma factor [Gemmataceae bacterium]|nr:sigma-70 family RNA polymerase sigma factor [Gemmataceae bacterium]MCI0738314.1 sigma-70 family RNA polymerase sigma factor [Gemmataceae bacterium]